VKLLWYLPMHAGFALAFMTKGPAGWLVPGLAAIGLIAWERRWREMLTWELWVGAVIPVSIIGAWAVAVLLSPDGMRTLTILLWSNIAERALSLPGGALGYAVGHRNWPGKYIVEFPLYVLPWTFLFVAAVHRVWRLARTAADSAAGGEQRRAWRFALCALIPPLLALSLAATSRGIYGAPLLLAAALMIGLWAKDGVFRPGTIDRRMMSATVWLVTLLATVLFASAAFIASADDAALRFAPLATGIAIGAAAAMWLSWRMLRRGEWSRAMAATIAGFLLSLLATAAVVFPAMDRWQDLDRLVRAIDRGAAGRPIALYSPDETTVATLDRVLGARAAHLARATSIPAARALLAGADPPVFIIRLKGRGTGAVIERLKSLGVRVRVRPPGETPELHELTTRLPLVVEQIFELPQGRRYALLARPADVPATAVPSGGGVRKAAIDSAAW
jgi:4-amino-4-deoxy-L-arabinose transferase-like glycosyltransferase